MAKHHADEPVLLLTPIGRDSALISATLAAQGIQARPCADAADLARTLQDGAGAAIIAEEALNGQSVEVLAQALAAQPPWSDLPVVVLSVGGESTAGTTVRLSHLSEFGNVTVIERPVRPATLVSVIRSALLARRRQHEVEILLHDVQIAQERLRTMIESVQDYAIINFDLAGHVTYWNSGAERLLGHTEAAILNAPFDLIFTDKDRREGVLAKELDLARRTGRAESEGWRVRSDGSRFWGSGVISLTRDRSGAVTGFVKVLRDRTDQKRAEEMLAEQAEALQRSNEDLQRFAYVASHDLQEPLRMVASYSQLLVRRNADRIDDDSRQFVRFIVTGVERMRTLIRDLLEYSRTTAEQPRELQPVDCHAVLGLALQNLQFKISESGATITFDRMPVVLAQETRLLQVFQNLIGNAMKYCELAPEVHISAARLGDFWCFGIRDNGIGIAPEHQERLFRLFERLHSRTEYPGSGIGLATCKRIIEQHGGKIWLESQKGVGSTFFFTVRPVEPEALAGAGG
ncbi:MAG TPA: ATP-binding protein [Bryobacteraceae bacterium]|nr:ATP-binding protein [Bryobacteraceae bacterium]